MVIDGRKEMVDRCDTEAFWFVFASCGRPFFAARDHMSLFTAIKDVRRKTPGATLERREGNYAAATLDELLSCWSEPKTSSDPGGAWIFVKPQDLSESFVEDQ